jgi:hypothetical protein
MQGIFRRRFKRLKSFKAYWGTKPSGDMYIGCMKSLDRYILFIRPLRGKGTIHTMDTIERPLDVSRYALQVTIVADWVSLSFVTSYNSYKCQLTRVQTTSNLYTGDIIRDGINVGTVNLILNDVGGTYWGRGSWDEEAEAYDIYLEWNPSSGKE